MSTLPRRSESGFTCACSTCMAGWWFLAIRVGRARHHQFETGPVDDSYVTGEFQNKAGEARSGSFFSSVRNRSSAVNQPRFVSVLNRFGDA